MTNFKLLGAICLLFVAGAYAAQHMPEGVKEMKAENGTTVLANTKGMTLYTYSKDESDKSMCTGTCAQNWPPLTAAADAKAEGDWKVITREDGTKQWAYKDKPLYTFAHDTKAGEVKGHGMGNGAWQVATP
jgi:predicted lipoprotein with Yx(FWY)xxD motif